MDTLQRNQQAFEGQSKGFSSLGDTYADEEGLEWMLAELPMAADANVLDVATGTGEFARALAPHVSSVIGVDATDAMLERGEHFVRENGIENIEFHKWIVQALPFGEQTFDIVTPEESMAEVYNRYERLCDPSHTRCVDFDELQSLFRQSGLEVTSARQRDIEESALE